MKFTTCSKHKFSWSSLQFSSMFCVKIWLPWQNSFTIMPQNNTQAFNECHAYAYVFMHSCTYAYTCTYSQHTQVLVNGSVHKINLNECNWKSVKPNSWAVPSYHVAYKPTCCMWQALDMLHVICTWLRSGHLSVHVGHSSQSSDEII